MLISAFESVTKAWVQDELDFTWEEAVEYFTMCWPAANKEDVGMFNLGKFKSANDPTVEAGRKYHYLDGQRQSTYDEIPGTVRRCKNNLISISGIVLDVDNHMSIIDVIDRYNGLEFVLYTTFRNLLPEAGEVEKFRVVVPFTQPLLAEDIEGRQASILELFPGVDQSSFTMSQSFYLHSGRIPITYHSRGLMIDPYRDLDYRAPQIIQVPKSTYSTDMDEDLAHELQRSVVESLLSCHGLGYRGKGVGVLTLVSICRSIGLSYDEYDEICRSISGHDSQLQQASVRLTAWQGWAGDRITKIKRDRFIKDYGGKPVVLDRDRLQKERKSRHQIGYENYIQSRIEMEAIKKVIEEKKR